jgi:DNA mismatch endonuclease, patch repair protein
MDNLTSAQRSLCMSHVRSANTSLEMLLRRELHRRGLRYALHRRDLAGTPDIVFTAAKVVVFVNGDFWHGFGYARWRHRLSPFWRTKIELNKRRDTRNAQTLRRSGWCVVTIWQHQLKRDLDRCVGRVVACLENRKHLL